MGFCFLITVFWRVGYFLTYKGFFCQSFDHEELVDLGGFLPQYLIEDFSVALSGDYIFHNLVNCFKKGIAKFDVSLSGLFGGSCTK